jgi:hypothetical protein
MPNAFNLDVVTRPPALDILGAHETQFSSPLDD